MATWEALLPRDRSVNAPDMRVALMCACVYRVRRKSEKEIKKGAICRREASATCPFLRFLLRLDALCGSRIAFGLTKKTIRGRQSLSELQRLSERRVCTCICCCRLLLMADAFFSNTPPLRSQTFDARAAADAKGVACASWLIGGCFFFSGKLVIFFYCGRLCSVGGSRFHVCLVNYV